QRRALGPYGHRRHRLDQEGQGHLSRGRDRLRRAHPQPVGGRPLRGAMTEISFYHLTRQPLNKALPRLLEKVLAAGHRAVVLAGSDERVEDLDAALWTYDPDSFLPHGTRILGHAERQPIYLTTEEENPNDAT